MKATKHGRTRNAGLIGGVLSALARPGLTVGIIRLESTDKIVSESLSDDIMAIGGALHFQIEPFDLQESLFDDPDGQMTKLVTTVCARRTPLLFVLIDYGDDASIEAMTRLLPHVDDHRAEEDMTGVLIVTQRSIADMRRVLDGASGRTDCPYHVAVIE